MKNFLVTLFIEDEIIKKKLTDLLSECRNGLLPKQILKREREYSFPFYKLEGNTVIDIEGNKDLQILVNGEKPSNSLVCHGDYITVKNIKTNIQYHALFINFERMNISLDKYKVDSGKNLFIGRADESNICININNSVSRKHAAIRIDTAGNAFIEDLSRKTGVYLNGKRVISQKLSIFDEVYIMGTSIIYMKDYICVTRSNKCNLIKYTEFKVQEVIENNEENNYFARTPRIMRSLEDGNYVIDPPTPFHSLNKPPMFLTMGPSLTMSLGTLISLGVTLANLKDGGNSSYVLTSGVSTATMLMGSIMWPLIVNKYEKNKMVESNAFRKQRYLEYLQKCEKEIKEKYIRNLRVLNENLSPNADALVEFLDSDEKKLRLWERSTNDEDFLNIRIGSGERTFDVNIQIPKEGFVLEKDELQDGPKNIFQKYSVLKDAPITIPFTKYKTIGMIGKRENILDISRVMALNICALHSYEDVKMVFVYDEKEEKDFEWIRELPHTWSNDRKIRYTATNKSEVHQVFSAIDEIVKEREEEEKENLPHFVFFISNEKIIEGQNLLRYIENSNNNVGISSVFTYGNITLLPKDCSVIIQSDDNISGLYSQNNNNNRFINFKRDNIDTKKLEQFADKLSNLPLKINSKNLSIPEKVSFLQMYKVGNKNELNIEKLWFNNMSHKTLAAPIGIKAGGEVFELDIHEEYHGCHGLVAGMTGAGKSEFLQEFILSMLINYSPNEVSFVLVDFKGGDMARPFLNIPHLSAVISNLSGNILYRALVSFEAEIKRRQNLFNESAQKLGIDKIDINSYHRYFKEGKLKEALPHMVIVIDEFAQLKTQNPEFLSKLIDVAQVGRSLGIHLILATQKPSGVVDAQIWSNARFKVCLKVLDTQDSSEMIKRKDAALIKQPGRCYVQVGYDEVFECIQSGYSGAEYVPTDRFIEDDEITVDLTDNTAVPIRSCKDDIYKNKTGRSQLEEIVSEVINIGKKNNIKSRPLWCKPLENKIYLSDVIQMFGYESKENNVTLKVNVGIVDLVPVQKQIPLEVDFIKDGNIALYGASGTGKTTFIQTLLYSLIEKYTPDQLNTYIFDFAGRTLKYFESAPHCGSVVFAGEDAEVESCIYGIENIIEERKVLFAENNCSSYEEYVSLDNNKLPAVVVIVDNYTAFKDRYYNLEDEFIKIISTGKAYGVFVLVTGNNKNSINYKVADHISRSFALTLNDRHDYSSIFNGSIEITPEAVKGRGVTIINDCITEYQTAIVVKADNESDRIERICERFKDISTKWDGEAAVDIKGTCSVVNNESNVSKEVNTSKPASSSSGLGTINPPEPISVDEHSLFVGTSLDEKVNYGFKLSELKTMLLIGVKDADKLTGLKGIIKNTANISEDNRSVIIIEGGNELEEFASTISENRYINSIEGFDKFVDELDDIFKERREKLKALEEFLEDEEDIYGNMAQEEKMFIFINRFEGFFDMISNEAADKFTNIVRECDKLGIYIISTADFETIIYYNSSEIYQYMIKTAYGVVCEGNLTSVYSGYIHDNSLKDISESQKEKRLENGSGILYSNDKFIYIKILK